MILAAICLSGNVFAESSYLVRFDLTPSIKNYLRTHDLDVTGINYKENHIEAFLTERELAEIQSQKTIIRYTLPITLIASPDDEYKNPDEIEDFVKDIHARHPDITELKIIGKTLEGREIFAIKISDNAKVDELEPAILVNGMHHAREVMTPEITTDMVEYLTSNYGSNSEVTHWVNNTEIWIIPMFNLDGNNKMWNGNSMWRKNARDEHGVDLNRNYPHGWNSCNGSSSMEGAQDYRGASAASEPETQAMMSFVASIKPVFNISYHSYSEIVIYPFGCRPLKTPTGEEVQAIGAEIGKKLDYKPGTAWELLYNADGGDIDWMYVEHQVIPFVIEVNSSWQGFHPGFAKWRDKTVLRNRPGWQYLLSRLEGTSVQGQTSLSDYQRIVIFRTGDTKAVQVYKINPDGSFYIMLKSGTYDFSFEGNKTKRFNSVVVNQKINLSF